MEREPGFDPDLLVSCAEDEAEVALFLKFIQKRGLTADFGAFCGEELDRLNEDYVRSIMPDAVKNP